MKVKVTETSKKCINLADVPAMESVIEMMENDASTLREYADTAIRIIYNEIVSDIKILDTDAEIAKNCRIWNRFSEESKDVDVFIRAIAFVDKREFIQIGAYITDIWDLNEKTNAEIAARIYTRKFREIL